MSTISEQDRKAIREVFNTLNNQQISNFKNDKTMLIKLPAITKHLKKENYNNKFDLEQGYAEFNPVMFQAFERMYLYKFLNEFDILESSSIAPSIFQTLIIYLVTATDSSESCRRDLYAYRNGKIIEYIMEDLKSKRYKEHLNKDPNNDIVAYAAQWQIVILLNMLYSETVAAQLLPRLEKEGIAEVIQHYIKSKNEQMRLWNLIMLSFLKNMDLLATIQAGDTIDFMVSILKHMLDTKNYGNNSVLHEIILPLSNLSELEQHQQRLVQAGLIPCLSRIIRGKLVEHLHWKPSEHNDEYCSFEKKLAVKCLYPYAIHSKFSSIVLEDESLLKELQSLAKNLNGTNENQKLLKTEVLRVFMAFDISITKEVREKPQRLTDEIIKTIENIKQRVRRETLKDGIDGIENAIQKYTIQQQTEKRGPVSTPRAPFTQQTAPIPQLGHIFISYSHQNTQRAMQLRDVLKNSGLPVWIDSEAIRGNSIEAMVLGLNDASLVVMCLSDGYRQSDFCKREAEYSVLKKKPFQPVILQEGFRMENDWLCFVVGLQNWIDLGGDLQFNANKAQFLEHVLHLLSTKASSIMPEESITKSHALSLQAAKPPRSGDSIDGHHSDIRVKLPSSPPKENAETKLNKWNIENVLKWLDDEHLADAKEKFKSNNFDGPMLLQLLELKKSSPDEVHKLLKNTLGLNPILCLRVEAAIGKLAIN